MDTMAVDWHSIKPQPERSTLESMQGASVLMMLYIWMQVWDFKSLKPECSLTGHGGDVKAVDWHPTKSAIASGSKDATVKLWDARAQNACLSTLELHKAPITQACPAFLSNLCCALMSRLPVPSLL